MLYVAEDIATGGLMDGWVMGTMDVNVLTTNVETAQAWKTDAKNFVVKIMRIKDEEGQTVKTKEDDSNKLLIDDVSGDEALSFWSRIAARHIHQPRIIIL